MPFDLPIFPLNIVLFPGMPLPLHIFEERYRLMVAHCLDNDRTFGVALIIEGEEGSSRTLPALIGCTAKIVDSTRLEDGRYNLQTEGRRRFQILALREQDDYLIGSVEWLDDEPGEDEAGEDEAAPRANQALRSLRRYLGAIGTNIGVEKGAMGVPDNVYDLSMWIAILLAVPNGLKQELLEMRSTEARLAREVELLRRAEVVQEAWTRRQSWPLPEEQPETPPNYAQFFSLN